MGSSPAKLVLFVRSPTANCPGCRPLATSLNFATVIWLIGLSSAARHYRKRPGRSRRTGRAGRRRSHRHRLATLGTAAAVDGEQLLRDAKARAVDLRELFGRHVVQARQVVLLLLD